MEFLNINWLKDYCDRPRVHGNGFIQLDVFEKNVMCVGNKSYSDDRIHFWGHPDIPKQKVETPIHDHVFDFISICLKGSLLNVVYKTIEGDDYTVYQPTVRREQDTVLLPTEEKVSLVYADYNAATVSLTGWSYHMLAYQIHETFVHNPTVTLMKKLQPTLLQNPGGPKPSVFVPRGVEPDNEFDRYAASTELLWDIIEEILQD